MIPVNRREYLRGGVAFLVLSVWSFTGTWSRGEDAWQPPEPIFTKEEVAAHEPKGPARCFRQICLEYNSCCYIEHRKGVYFRPDVLREHFSEADPVAYAEFCKRINLDAALVLSVPQDGYTTYLQTKVGEPYPYLKEKDLDFFGEVTRELHNRGISVFGYICIGWSKKAKIDFPEEFAGSTMMSLNGEYAEQVLQYAGEILSHYPVDGLRTDILDHNTRTRLPGDKALYRELYGEEMPAKYPSWEREQNFRLASISRFMKRFYKVCKDTKPSVPVWHNWVGRRNYADLRAGRYMDIAYEEFSDPFSTLFTAGVFGKEAIISGDILRPASGAQPQRRLTFLLGGRGYSYFPVNRKTALMDNKFIEWFVDKGGYGSRSRHRLPPNMAWFDTDLAPLYAMVRDVEPFLVGARPVPDLGVVFSEASRFRLPRWKRDSVVNPLRGLVSHQLKQNRIPVFMSGHHLPERKDLSSFRLMLVPEMSGFEADELEALTRYARGGGTVLLTGEAMLYDEDGKPRENFSLAKAMGLQFKKQIHKPWPWPWRNTDFQGEPACIDIPAPGKQTVNLWMREANACIDQLAFTQDLAFRATDAAVSASQNIIVVEPEDATDRVARNGRAWKNDTGVPGFKGRGYLVGEGAPYMSSEGCSEKSARISIPVDFPAKGKYKVWVRWAGPHASADSVFVGLNGKEMVAMDLDQPRRHPANQPVEENEAHFAVTTDAAWKDVRLPVACDGQAIIVAEVTEGTSPSTFSLDGKLYPLVHVHPYGKGRIVYSALVNDMTHTLGVIDHLLGASPVTTIPADTQAYLMHQAENGRWLLHLMNDGDYSVTISKGFAKPSKIAELYPKTGWTAELTETENAVRVTVSGQAKDRLLVLE